MGWLNAITTANRETRRVESDERGRETDIRLLQRMRQVDADAATERERQRMAKEAAQQNVPDFVGLDAGSGYTPAAPQAPAAPPPGIPTAPAQSFTQQQIARGQASQLRQRNTTPDVTPNQSAAESARLGRMAAARGPYQKYVGAAQAQYARGELERLNPSAGQTTNQSAAESSRLLGMGTPQAPSAPAGGGDKAAFIQQYMPAAQRAGAALGVDPRVLLAQWGLETGWGKSVIPGTNNLGNIKDMQGGGVAARDNMTGSTDRYRQFGSADEFADHYAGLISRRYPGAVGAGSDMGKFAGAMRAGGYAEDPNYVAKLQQTYGGMPAGQAPTAGNTQVASAAAPQLQGAAPQTPGLPPSAAIPEDTVGGRGAGDSQAMQIARMQMSELRGQLQFAKTAEDAMAIRGKMATLAAGVQEIQVRNAAGAAMQDDKALTSLARTAAAPFAQTPQGFVLVQPDANGNWRPTSRPVDRATLITHLVGVLTGSGAAQAAEQRKQDFEMQKALVVEQQKGLNALREVAARGNIDLQRELTKNQLGADDVLGVETNQTTGQQLVRTRRGVFEIVPGADLGGGMRGVTTMRPVAVQ